MFAHIKPIITVTAKFKILSTKTVLVEMLSLMPDFVKKKPKEKSLTPKPIGMKEIAPRAWAAFSIPITFIKLICSLKINRM